MARSFAHTSRSLWLRRCMTLRSGVVLIVCFGAPLLRAGDTPVTLTVKVRNDEGKELSGAMVAVYQNHPTLAKWIILPPDLREETNASGIATIKLKVPSGKAVSVHVEVSREDYQSKTRDIAINEQGGGDLSPEFVLISRKKDAETAAGSTTTFNITVTRKDTGDPVGGANIQILSLGGFSPQKFETTSDANGKAQIVTPLNNMFEVNVAKDNYAPYHGGAGGADTPYLKQRALDVKLDRQMNTHFVTVSVRDAQSGLPVSGARVVLIGLTSGGFHSESTDPGGRVTLGVGEFGQFTIKISQDYYNPYEGEVRVVQGDEKQELGPFDLEPKPKKEEGKDEITVTVLKKDPSEPKSSPAPFPGAMVKVEGGGAIPTDQSGQAVIKGSFEPTVEVSVTAPGYTPQKKMVNLMKLMRYSGGSASTSFVLESDGSVEGPIGFVVEVISGTTKVAGASVEFILPEKTVAGQPTDSEGHSRFSSSDAPSVPVEELRKGLKVRVKATGYNEAENSVPGDWLKPIAEGHTFLVQLDVNWDELRAAIAELQARVAAWKNQNANAPSGEMQAGFVEKALAAKQRAQELLREIENAGATFHVGVGPGLETQHCKKAKQIAAEISDLVPDTERKAADAKNLIAEAQAAADRCSASDDPEKVRGNYRDAIKALGEVGVRNKKALKLRDELLEIAKETTALQGALETLKAKQSEIGQQRQIAEENAKAATQAYLPKTNEKGARAQQDALKAALAQLKQKYDPLRSTMPKDLQSALDDLSQRINAPDVVSLTNPAKNVPESVLGAAQSIQEFEKSASSLFDVYQRATCDIDTMQDTVDKIGEAMDATRTEVTLAANLPKQADECAARLAANDVTVPDLSALSDAKAMIAAATQAGLRPSLVATPAKSGTTKLLARQDPLAGAKAKRGAQLTIFLNQQIAEGNSPTPTATAVAAASPTPSASDEVTVPDLSREKDIGSMMSVAAAAGLTPAIAATTATPPPNSGGRLFAGQSLKAGAKAKRGEPITISIYQSVAENSRSPSPSPTASASPTAVAKGTMPDLRKLTLDQAMSRLSGKMRIGAITQGARPPTPRDELTIYAQTPAPGSRIELDNEVVISVSLYGSAEGVSSASASPSGPAAPSAPGLPQFDGSYSGHYTGSAKTGFGNVKTGGAVQFTISNGVISIRKPGSGTGNVSPDGSASFGGGMDDGSQYTFSGTFNSSGRGVSGQGRWSAQFDGGSASGTWSASR